MPLEQLLESIRSAVVNGELKWNDDPAVYALANKHDLGHLVNQEKSMEAIYRCTLQEQALAEIEHTLVSSKIEYVLLKGVVLRSRYPESWMRTSADIDILVRPEDLVKAEEALQDNGYRIKGKANNHTVLTSPSGVTLELHFALYKATTSAVAKKLLDNIWEDPNNSKYFYLHVITHMADHFQTGGCGMRSIVDMYFLKDADNSLVLQAGLGKFEQAAKDLMIKWLEDSSLKVDTDFEQWILQGGVYGTIEQGAHSRASQGKTLVRRLLPTFEEMQFYFPELKMKSQLPQFWLKRIVKHTKRFGGTRISKELRSTLKFDKDAQSNIKAMFDRLEI